MEKSVAEEAEASNQKKEKDTTIKIVKLEFIEAEYKDEEDTYEEEPEETKNINPIPG